MPDEKLRKLPPVLTHINQTASGCAIIEMITVLNKVNMARLHQSAIILRVSHITERGNIFGIL